MIEKAQYGDFNRFSVSIGLILLALGVLLPYLYMKESFDLLIKKDDLTLLTPIAQEIINSRQGYIQKLVLAIPFLSIGSVLAGITLLIIGIKNWRKRQVVEDNKLVSELNKTIAEEAKLKAEESKIRKEGEKLSQPEIVENKRREIEKSEPSLSTSEKNLSVLNYLLVEAMIAEKFKQEYSDRYNVHSNYKINNQKFDIILERINNNTEGINLNKDAIVEVKYVRKIDKRLVRDTFQKIGNALKAYPKAITNPIIIFVSNDVDENTNKEELLSSIISEWSEKTISKWIVRFVNVEDLPTIKLKDIINI
jgi:hypothetical protein